jgi:hypothetical protein
MCRDTRSLTCLVFRLRGAAYRCGCSSVWMCGCQIAMAQSSQACNLLHFESSLMSASGFNTLSDPNGLDRSEFARLSVNSIPIVKLNHSRVVVKPNFSLVSITHQTIHNGRPSQETCQARRQTRSRAPTEKILPSTSPRKPILRP